MARPSRGSDASVKWRVFLSLVGDKKNRFPNLSISTFQLNTLTLKRSSFFMTSMHLRCCLYAVVLIVVGFVFSSKGIKRHDSARKDRGK